MRLPSSRERGIDRSPSYPRKAQIARAIGAARENGILVNSFQVGRDGHIQVGYVPPTAVQNGSTDEDEFQRWEREGRL